MAKGVFKSIEAVCKSIKKDLDTPPNPNKPESIKIAVLYACNTSGKTRISKHFSDKFKGTVLYYNAYTEDLFNWDNESYILKIDANAPIFKAIKDQTLDRQIVENFQRLTGSKLEPDIDLSKSQIGFGIQTGDSEGSANIKISRSEESIFKWSVFYTVLDAAINALNEKIDEDSETGFDNIQYVVIDDPVSSMDDTRIITVALELAKLISKSTNQFKFLITTHHALFFNVLYTTGKNEKNWDRKNYVLSKSETDFHLKGQGNDSPFAYHHMIITEIKDAIKNKEIKRYHFNLFRSLLEKTANFLGYENKNKCFEIMTDENTKDGLEVFKKTLEHYSHNSLWDLEPKNVSELEQVAFEQSFKAFINKFNWGNI